MVLISCVCTHLSVSEDHVSLSVQLLSQTPHGPPHPLWFLYSLLVGELVEALVFPSWFEAEQFVFLKLLHEPGHVLLPLAGQGCQAGQVPGQVHGVSSYEEKSVQVFGLRSGQLSAVLHLLPREAAFTELYHTWRENTLLR